MVSEDNVVSSRVLDLLFAYPSALYPLMSRPTVLLHLTLIAEGFLDYATGLPGRSSCAAVGFSRAAFTLTQMAPPTVYSIMIAVFVGFHATTRAIYPLLASDLLLLNIAER
jgi:hypothetical protein